MAYPSYKRPPITEAVIEIRFTSLFTNGVKLTKAIKNLKKLYSHHREIINHDIEVKVDGSEASARSTPQKIQQFSSSDMTELLTIQGASLLFSQLAPYGGWDKFFQRFTEGWRVWRKAMGHKDIVQIGVRYINRLDIPASGATLEYEEFLEVYPKLPESFGPPYSYAVQATSLIEDISCVLKLNSAVVPSPLSDHISFVIDQDIIKDTCLPQKDEDIYSLLNSIREKKNEIFEACISNKARELFN